jgi:putative phosphoesterase
MSEQTHEGFALMTSGRGFADALDQSLKRLQPDDLGAAWVAARDRRRRAAVAAPAALAPQRAAGARHGEGRKSSARESIEGSTAALGDGPATDAGEPRSGHAAGSGARIGVISDNHGYLDPSVLEVFSGVTHIIHAGDIVDPEILERLRTVAPVTAVVGNMDTGGPTAELPRHVVGEVAGVRFVVGHKRKRLLKDLAAGSIEGLPRATAPDLVIYGHDHVPAAAWVDGTLYLDPGSASAPHEEDDGPTVAIVEVRPAGLAVTFVPLERREAAEAKARSKG